MKRTAMAVLTMLAGTCALASEPKPSPAGDDPLQQLERGNDCLFVRSIQNWRVLDSTHIVVNAPNARQSYLLTLSFPLSELKWTWKLAFIDDNSDGNLCGFGGDAVVVPDDATRWRSAIRGVSKLDDAAVAGIEQRYDVKLRRPLEKEADGDAKSEDG